MGEGRFLVRGRDLMTMAAPMAGFSAVLCNSLLFFGGSLSGILSPNVRWKGEPMHILDVFLFSFFPCVLAGLFLLLLALLIRGLAWATFRVICFLSLSLALFNPFLLGPLVPFGMTILVFGMHVVVLLNVVYFFKEKALVPSP